MLMTLSDQIASFSVEVSDENISGCKSILCRFCLCFLQAFFDDDTRRGYFLSMEHLLAYRMNTLSRDTWKSWLWQNHGKETPRRWVVSFMIYLLWIWNNFGPHQQQGHWTMQPILRDDTADADMGRFSISDLRDMIDISDFVNFVLWKLDTKKFDL